MRSFSCLTAGLAALLVSSAAVAGPPTRTLLFKGAVAAPGDTPEIAARALVKQRAPWAASLALGAARVADLASGERTVRLPQMHQGLPVALRGAAVTFAKDGAARLVAVTLEEDLPSDVTPAIDAVKAVDAAAKHTGLRADPSDATLAIWPGADGPLLAWVVYGGAALGVPYAPVAVVDAKTGELVLRYNAVVDLNQSEVYPSNPVKSPTLVPVTLTVGAGNTVLENALIKSHNCIDQQNTKSIMGLTVHTCDLLQTATPDGNGDYLITPGADTDPEDAFSEVSMFYHANRAYDFFRAFQPGFTVQAGPLDTVSNLRMPDGFATFDLAKMADPNLPLVPFQNAFFAPSNPIFSQVFGLSGAAMWFGQGPNRDYSYDGDVVYHEFGHAVVAATVDFVGAPHKDEFGVVYSPGGMNEGIADYFSSALTGDGDVGEYASQDFAPGSSAIRSLTDPDKCPTAIGGEVHQDATLFSAGLWDVRVTLSAAEQSDFDAAVFAAMGSAPTGDLGYDEFATMIVEALAASPLGQTVADAQTAAFTARGVLPKCGRVLEATSGQALIGPLQGIWFAPGTTATGIKNLGWTPGVIQFHVALAPSATGLPQVTVDFTKVNVSSGGGGFGTPGTPFAPKVLVRFGPDPITFTYGPFAAAADVQVVDPTDAGSNKFNAVAVGPAGATSAYVMIASSGEEDGAFSSVKLTSGEAQDPTGSGGAGGGGGGATTGAGAGGSAPKADGTADDDSGCGCHVPGSGGAPVGGGVAAALLGLAALVRRRRAR